MLYQNSWILQCLSISENWSDSHQKQHFPFDQNWYVDLKLVLWFCCQPVAVSGITPEGYWRHDASAFQNDLPNSIQSHLQKPSEMIPTYEGSQNQQNSTFSQGSSDLYPATYQVSQSNKSSFQTVLQPPELLASRGASKLQIPTNPRIASNLSLGLSKTEKDSSMTSAGKPAYISVPVQKANEQVMPEKEADSMLKVRTLCCIQCTFCSAWLTLNNKHNQRKHAEYHVVFAFYTVLLLLAHWLIKLYML